MNYYEVKMLLNDLTKKTVTADSFEEAASSYAHKYIKHTEEGECSFIYVSRLYGKTYKVSVILIEPLGLLTEEIDTKEAIKMLYDEAIKVMHDEKTK